MWRAQSAVGVVLIASLSACATRAQPDPEPDFATIRAVAWTNTVEKLAGSRAPGTTKPWLYDFDGRATDGTTSIVHGDNVVSAVATNRGVTLVGQSAKSGAILWRRPLFRGSPLWASARCSGDVGLIFACTITRELALESSLWLIDRRTGDVVEKDSVDALADVGVDGDDLYVATFTPARRDTRLDVAVIRRPWRSEGTSWTRKASFAIEGWDGANGIMFDKDRVTAFSGSWQVILDKQSGRVLGRSNPERWEHRLDSGTRVLVEDGGAGEQIDVTLFSPDGKPLAEVDNEVYAEPLEAQPDLVAVGRHLLSRVDGKVNFTAPKGQRIVAVGDGGRVAVTEPVDFLPLRLTAYDTKADRKIGAVNVPGDNWSGAALSSGRGMIKLMGDFGESDVVRSPTIYVLDITKPRIVATIRLAESTLGFDVPTVARSVHGAVVTGAGAVRGLVPPHAL